MAGEAPLRWAILGVGRAGAARAKSIGRDRTSELVAVYRGRRAEETGAPIVETVDEAIERADVVCVCSPDDAHVDQIRAILRAGRHAVCEYPVAGSEAEARELFDLARSVGRVLHVAHVELLGAAAATLRSNVHPVSVRRISLTFQRRGDEVAGSGLALGNVSRLHRIVDFAGPVASIEHITAKSGQLRARLILESDAPCDVVFEQNPYFARWLFLEVIGLQGRWRLENRTLFRDRTPQTLLEAVGVFDQDHVHVLRRVREGEADTYVTEERILHVLRVAERLRDGARGPLA